MPTKPSFLFRSVTFKSNIPADKHTPTAVFEFTFMIVKLDFVDVESPHFEIMLDEIGDLFVSVSVFPRLEADYGVPSGRYVALTNLRMTSSLLFLHPRG
jgi:hypothetical protein